MLKLWFSIVMSFLGHECTLALVRGLLRWSFASFYGTLSESVGESAGESVSESVGEIFPVFS